MDAFYSLPLEARAARMAELAREALKLWDVTDCTPELVKLRENAVFRVRAPDGRAAALRPMPLFYLARGFTYLGWIHTRRDTRSAQQIAPKVIALVCDLAEDYLRD